MKPQLRPLWLAALAIGCSVGQGSGRLDGTLNDQVCGYADSYSLGPTFFVADIIADRGAPPGEGQNRMNVRIQRGSYREGESDGLLLYLHDVNRIRRELLGMPLELSDDPDALVQATLYLNQTCSRGGAEDFFAIPGILAGRRGTVTFDALYAPDVSAEDAEITARFENMAFEDPTRPEARSATLSGEVSFLFQRGRPGQNFP